MSSSKPPAQPYSAKALKDLDRVRASTAGWSQQFYGRLLAKFGFVCRRGKHDIYGDPADGGNRVSIPRHGELPAYVGEQVIAAIERKLAREELL